MHDDQISISSGTVRALIDEQFPRWRNLEISEVPSAGTVNAIFRIGDHLTARFPLRPAPVEATRGMLAAEMRAARELAGRTRFPTPEPVAIGEPAADYPMPWCVQSWLPGTVAAEQDPGDSAAFARDLAEFIAGIRAVDTAGRTFRGTGRGGDLAAHDAWMQTCFERSERLMDVPRLRRMWARLRRLPREAGDAMTHGDLIPGNLLVRGGRLVGVLDVGGFGPADPALDLVVAWHLLEPRPREVLRRELGCGALEWLRGKAWAFEQAMGAIWYYRESNPTMSRMGLRTMGRLLADEARH